MKKTCTNCSGCGFLIGMPIYAGITSTTGTLDGANLLKEVCPKCKGTGYVDTTEGGGK